ncbi:hypothetical protein CLFE_045790 (plasmid) [Clostridium felsineum DSM 794]|nr:hypothetical protein CLFE_045790 [Clostridium felsineum DSM 794]
MKIEKFLMDKFKAKKNSNILVAISLYFQELSYGSIKN